MDRPQKALANSELPGFSPWQSRARRVSPAVHPDENLAGAPPSAGSLLASMPERVAITRCGINANAGRSPRPKTFASELPTSMPAPASFITEDEGSRCEKVAWISRESFAE